MSNIVKVIAILQQLSKINLAINKKYFSSRIIHYIITISIVKGR